MEGRILPHNDKAEKALLGAMLLDPVAFSDALEIVTAESFYNRANRLIFQALFELSIESKSIDYLILEEQLKKSGNLEVVGGTSYLIQLVEDVTVTANAREYATIVAEKKVLRDLIRATTEIAELGYSGATANELLEQAESKIFAIAENKSAALTPISTVVKQSLELIEQRFTSPESLTGLSTGFIDLDYFTSGFQRSDLILLGARPSMGKTALGLNICRNIAKNGHKIAMFSLEMAMIQYVERMIAAESLIELNKIKSGRFEDDDWPKLIAGISNLGNMHIYIDDSMGISVTEMMAKCRKLKRESGLDFILIDYLQLMSGDSSENRQQEISSISRGLKGLARELDVPILALSQLSRGPEQRADHRPMLSDLRESGAIEQDADIVMFLYREKYHDRDNEALANRAELIIAKQRNGEIGTVDLHWLGQYQLFRDLSWRQE